jgi:hypothetical protein
LGQGFISFFDVMEPGLSVFVARIFIGMEFVGQFTVLTPDLFAGRHGRASKNGIVILHECAKLTDRLISSIQVKKKGDRKYLPISLSVYLSISIWR